MTNENIQTVYSVSIFNPTWTSQNEPLAYGHSIESVLINAKGFEKEYIKYYERNSHIAERVSILVNAERWERIGNTDTFRKVRTDETFEYCAF